MYRTGPLLLVAALSAPAPVLAEDDPTIAFRRSLQLDLAYERETDDDDRDREGAVSPLFRLITEIRPDRIWSGFAEIDLFSERVWERGEARTTTNTARINQAYLQYDDGFEIRAGRWLYRDEREWLIDENLDGIQAQFDWNDIRIDALAGRVGWLPRDIFEPRSRGDRIAYYGLLARIEPVDDRFVEGFAILGDDRARDGGEQLSIGLRSWGEIAPGTTFWADAGLSRGQADGDDLGGYGLDVGATRIWDDLALQPRVTLALAQGSGDGNAADGTDRTYRQTGLQSNEARLGGFAKLNYYGEALDPDLANIRIATAGFGVTASEAVSLDLVYHHYRRVAVQTGEDRHLGDGLDLVMGLRPTDALEIDAAIGWFAAGDTDNDPDRRMAARIEIEYDF